MIRSTMSRRGSARLFCNSPGAKSCTDVTRHLGIALIACLPGCFYVGGDQYADILQKPSVEWSSRDDLTVLISPIAHNLFDQGSPNVKVFATPYYPSVIIAIARGRQRLSHWSETQYQSYAEGLAKDDLGMYIDWDKNAFVDSRGNYFRDPLQIDSLMFLVTIHNNGWPPNVVYGPGNGAMILIAAGMYQASISNLEDNIYLVNDKAKFIRPQYVWGKRNKWLTFDETLFVMFRLRNGEHHFLEGSENMYLGIKGFEKDIMLTFPLSAIQ